MKRLYFKKCISLFLGLVMLVQMTTMGIGVGSAKASVTPGDDTYANGSAWVTGWTGVQTIVVNPNPTAGDNIVVSGLADVDSQVEVALFNGATQIGPTYLAKDNYTGATEYSATIDLGKTTMPGNYTVRAKATGYCQYTMVPGGTPPYTVLCDTDYLTTPLTVDLGLWTNNLNTEDTTPTITGTVNDPSAVVTIEILGNPYTAINIGNVWSADVTDTLAVGIYDIKASTAGAADSYATLTITNNVLIGSPTRDDEIALGIDCAPVAGNYCATTIQFGGTNAKAGDILELTPYNVTMKKGELRHILTNANINNGYDIEYLINKTRPSPECRKKCRVGVSVSIIDGINGTPVTSVIGGSAQVAPSMPILISPVDGAYRNSASLFLNWSDSTDANGDLITYEYQSAWAGGSYGPVSTGTKSFIKASGSAENIYAWQVRACDAVDCSAWTTPFTLTIDNTNPTDPGTPVANRASPTRLQNVTWTWTSSSDTNLKNYAWTIEKDNIEVAKGSVVGTSLTKKLTFSDGSYVFKVHAVDKAGNISGIVSSVPLVADYTAPAVPTLVSPADPLYTTATNITFNWNAVTDAYRYRVQFCNVDPGDLGATCTDQLYQVFGIKNATTNYTFSSDAHFWWRVRVRDAIGNLSAWSESREVTIDNTAPDIKITGSNPITVEVGSSFTDPGCTVTDNFDTTVLCSSTGTVDSTKVGVYTITYNATDKTGNSATPQTRTINVVDTQNPVITLKGSNDISIALGSSYIDEGATASDNYYGDITSSIVKTGSVNTSIAGTYTIAYDVTDVNGNNATTVYRTVRVIAPAPPSNGSASSSSTSSNNTSGTEGTTDVAGLTTGTDQNSSNNKDKLKDAIDKINKSEGSTIVVASTSKAKYLWIVLVILAIILAIWIIRRVYSRRQI